MRGAESGVGAKIYVHGGAGAKMFVRGVAEPMLVALQSRNEALEKELQVSRDREFGLKWYCYETRESDSTKVWMQGLPNDLADWIKADWPHA